MSKDDIKPMPQHVYNDLLAKQRRWREEREKQLRKIQQGESAEAEPPTPVAAEWNSSHAQIMQALSGMLAIPAEALQASNSSNAAALQEAQKAGEAKDVKSLLQYMYPVNSFVMCKDDVIAKVYQVKEAIYRPGSHTPNRLRVCNREVTHVVKAEHCSRILKEGDYFSLNNGDVVRVEYVSGNGFIEVSHDSGKAERVDVFEWWQMRAASLYKLYPMYSYVVFEESNHFWQVATVMTDGRLYLGRKTTTGDTVYAYVDPHKCAPVLPPGQKVSINGEVVTIVKGMPYYKIEVQDAEGTTSVHDIKSIAGMQKSL